MFVCVLGDGDIALLFPSGSQSRGWPPLGGEEQLHEFWGHSKANVLKFQNI